MMKKVILCLLLVFLSSCELLKPTSPIQQQSIQSTINTTISINNTINQSNITTQITEPPKPILVPVNESLAVYIIDTYKKGSIILISNNNSIIVNIPGGSDQLRIFKIIKNLGIKQPDYLIATNELEDNIAGFIPFLLRIHPKNLIHSGIPSLSPSYKQYNKIYNDSIIVPRDMFFAFGESVIDLIVPYDDEIPLTNDNSILVKINYGKTKILITTDCEFDCETRVSDFDLQSQIVISNGGCNSLTYSFLQESVKPELVIFSQFPCQETLQRVESLDISTLITKTNGDILITSNGDNYKYQYKK